MKEIEILKDLFDEKIIEIIKVFTHSPDESFSLSQISSLSKINIATSLRIINKLAQKGFLLIIKIGKSKAYQLEKGERALFLFRLLQNKEDSLNVFLDKIKTLAEIKKVILESRNQKEAKILLVGNHIPIEEIRAFSLEIEKNQDFKINFVPLSEKQFEDLEKLNVYNLTKKIIWEKQ